MLETFGIMKKKGRRMDGTQSASFNVNAGSAEVWLGMVTWYWWSWNEDMERLLPESAEKLVRKL